MKNTYEWLSAIFGYDRKGFLELSEPAFRQVIEAIQKDALSDCMADTTAQQEFEMTRDMCNKLEDNVETWKEMYEEMRSKWLESRRYLRAANKGAERNHAALQLAVTRYHESINSDRRWKQRDEFTHKTVVWNWLLLSDEEIAQKADCEVSSVHTCRKLLKAMLGTSVFRI